MSPEYVRIESPFEDRPTRAALRDQLKDHLVRGLVKIKDETFTFVTGTNSYTLSQVPVSPTSSNFEMEGTLNGVPHMFVIDTDYSISGKTITWNTDNDTPDNNSNFYVDYTYQGTKSGVTDEDPASLLMIRAEAFGNTIDDVYDDLVNTHYAGYVESATGSDLEKVGALVGSQRTGAQKATGILKLIFTQAATIGDPVTVSANDRFSTRPSSTEDPIYFETTTGSTWSAGETYGNIGITALIAGRSGNVGNNTIINLVDSITNVESVSNPAKTDGGADKEADNDYRDKISLAKESKGKSTKGGIEYDLLNIAGVASVKSKEHWFATADSVMFITPTTFPPSTTLQNQVSSALNSGSAFGTKIRAQYPNVVNAWLQVTLERTANSDSGAVFNTASGDIWSYMESLNLGERFIQQQFSRQALQHVDAIRVKDFKISETGNTDLWINPDQVLRVGYRVSGTGNSLGVFNEAESLSATGYDDGIITDGTNYSTGYICALGLDTYDSGLTVYANRIYSIDAVYLSGNQLAVAGTDYRLYSSGVTYNGYGADTWNYIEWLSGATNYPLNGTPYSIMYRYNAINVDMTQTGEF